MSHSISMQHQISILKNQLKSAGFLDQNEIPADATITVSARALDNFLQEADEVNCRLQRIEEDDINIDQIYNDLAEWLRYRDALPSRSLQDSDSRRFATLIEDSELDRKMAPRVSSNSVTLFC